MNYNNKIFQNILVVLVILFAGTSCQKLSRPEMGDYPKDANPPGGPLEFYVAFDGTSVDSTRANFGADNTIEYSDGVSGKAFKGGSKSYVQYGKANNFANVTSFTIAFWIKKKPQPAGAGTNFAFALNAKGYSWTNLQLFFEFEDAGNPSTEDLAAGKLYILDQWFEYVGTKRMPKVLNGQWHQLAFTYDESTSKLITYIDGAPFTALPAGFGDVKDNGAPRGKLHFSNITGFTIGGPGKVAQDANGWMGNINGELDQFRLYNTALSAADISALFSGKK